MADRPGIIIKGNCVSSYLRWDGNVPYCTMLYKPASNRYCTVRNGTVHYGIVGFPCGDVPHSVELRGARYRVILYRDVRD